jgi:hypothetical protein
MSRRNINFSPPTSDDFFARSRAKRTPCVTHHLVAETAPSRYPETPCPAGHIL